MILSILFAVSLQAQAANYVYKCFANGDISTHLPATFTLEQNDQDLTLKSYLQKDIELGLKSLVKSKAYYDITAQSYKAFVKADNRLRTGGYKTPEGSYVGALEVTYDDYREEYFQVYFCKRK
ncbi:MAG: hypothetical protein ACOYL6_10550 [Bacteriovoracaceae bacterium]